MSEQEGNFESWALVELFGRNRIVGKVTEQSIGGCAFVRVDVPAHGNEPAYTKFYGNGAIYAMSPVTEQAAMKLLDRVHQPSISRYDLPAPIQIAAPAEHVTSEAHDDQSRYTDDRDDDDFDDQEY